MIIFPDLFQSFALPMPLSSIAPNALIIIPTYFPTLVASQSPSAGSSTSSPSISPSTIIPTMYPSATITPSPATTRANLPVTLQVFSLSQSGVSVSFGVYVAAISYSATASFISSGLSPVIYNFSLPADSDQNSFTVTFLSASSGYNCLFSSGSSYTSALSNGYTAPILLSCFYSVVANAGS